jgi:hypothetical protein
MKKFFGSLAVAAIAALLSPALKADTPPHCSMGNAIMQGTYVASGTGTITGVGAIATVGLIVYNGDGSGNAVLSTTTVNGAASTKTNVPISFTVNPDCTGSKVLGTTHMNFVITPDGTTITWIITDNGVTMMGTGVRLKR